ncbi:MAG: hypothetical protein CL678_11665 [Bdellovibrionaceae bacterium]|nr:hypothetical protein [Pseudobdellovibrionaceae bacterium]|tara:strand:+ start:852 stop:1502 length:651 start_codon:yes stop_codon:yes gene_type:complete
MYNFNNNIIDPILDFLKKNILSLLIIIGIIIIVFMQNFRIINSTMDFVNKNIAIIILTSLLFFCIAILLVIFNIKFSPPKKPQVVREIVIETFDQTDDDSNLIPSAQIKTDEESEFSNILSLSDDKLRTNETCNKLTNKESCVSLGTCVWVTAQDNKEKFRKCIAASDVSKGYIPGSEGPEDKCVKNSKGKFIPWEEFYYLNNGKMTKGKGIETCD